MKSIKFIVYFFLVGMHSICSAQNFCGAEELECQRETAMCQEECESPCSDYNLFRVEGGYAFGEFFALNKNYGELGLFIAPTAMWGMQPFVDLRGFMLSNRKGAASGGVGLRYLNDCSQRIYGANAYYDYQNAKYDGFQWVGVGLEALGETLDFRINGHYCLNGFAAGNEEFEEVFPDGFTEFYQLAESPVSGVEAEVGYHVFKSSCWSLYGFIGPYYYKTLSDHIYGGYAGLKLDLSNYLTLESQVSHDHVYGTRVQGKFLISASFNSLFNLGLSEVNEDSARKDFLSQPVRRHKMLFVRDWM